MTDVLDTRIISEDLFTFVEEEKQEKALTWRQKTFARWMALPTSERPEGAESYGEVAQLLKVKASTLSNWKRLPGFWDEVYADARSIIGDRVPEILYSMATQAEKGSVSAAKLCLQVLGVFDEKYEGNREIIEPLIIVMGGRDKEALPPPIDAEFSVGKIVNNEMAAK